MVVPLEQSEAWIGLYTEAVDVSETLAGKLFGARRAKGLSRFLETHLLALLFIRAAFYVSVALYLPWLARIVTDAAFFSTVPLGMLWALYLYSSAHVPTLRALLTSFDVVYIMLLATSGTVALCDILRWDSVRTGASFGIMLPFAAFIGVLWDALSESRRFIPTQGRVFAPFIGVIFFLSLPLMIFLDVVPDITVNQYSLGQIDGRDVSFSTFSVMLSSFSTVAAFFFRWGVTGRRYPNCFIALKAPMLAQAPFDNSADEPVYAADDSEPEHAESPV